MNIWLEKIFSIQHRSILSSEQGPRKGVAEIQRSILFTGSAGTNGMKWLKPWDMISFFSSSNKSSDLSYTFESVLVTTASRHTEMWVVWGTNVFYVFSLRLLTHWICHPKWTTFLRLRFEYQGHTNQRICHLAHNFLPFQSSSKAFK